LTLVLLDSQPLSHPRSHHLRPVIVIIQPTKELPLWTSKDDDGAAGRLLQTRMRGSSFLLVCALQENSGAVHMLKQYDLTDERPR
jgi:hypothetical protein